MPLRCTPNSPHQYSRVNIDLDRVHVGVALLVIGCIHQHLVKDLEQAGHEGDLSLVHAHLIIVHIHGLREGFARADVCVGPQQDVLQLTLLLVDALHREPLVGLVPAPGRGLPIGGAVHSRRHVAKHLLKAERGTELYCGTVGGGDRQHCLTFAEGREGDRVILWHSGGGDRQHCLTFAEGREGDRVNILWHNLCGGGREGEIV